MVTDKPANQRGGLTEGHVTAAGVLMLTSSVLPFICIFNCFMSPPAASLSRVVSMVTAEEEAPLVCLSGTRLRRDPDTRSGLRSPAAADKGDLQINVSVAAAPSPTVLQLWTAVDSAPLESCVCFHSQPSDQERSHRSKGKDPNLRLSDAESQRRRRRRRLSGAAAFLFCSPLQKTVR